jgi:hypothetical protein
MHNDSTFESVFNQPFSEFNAIFERSTYVFDATLSFFLLNMPIARRVLSLVWAMLTFVCCFAPGVDVGRHSMMLLSGQVVYDRAVESIFNRPFSKADAMSQNLRPLFSIHLCTPFMFSIHRCTPFMFSVPLISLV